MKRKTPGAYEQPLLEAVVDNARFINYPFYRDTPNNRLMHQALRIVTETSTLTNLVGCGSMTLSRLIQDHQNIAHKIIDFQANFQGAIRLLNGSQNIDAALSGFFLYPEHLLLPYP
jgi:hypothetical protein